ncbi:hypothetical protein K9M50_02100, partial [Patescibacteria group bacterium]|nr:hypothetical protein [Patescibacteria group bacterium]
MFNTNNRSKKTAITFFVLFFIIFSFLSGASITKAVAPTAVVESVPEKTTNILDKIKNLKDKIFSEVGTNLLNNVLRNTLNRLAYDSADAIVSGASGQKPLFVTKNMGDYLTDIGDAAAGDFLDQLNHLGSMNLCEPDLNITASIGLGLKDVKRPPEPSCKASTMVKSWKDEVQKFQDMTSDDFTRKFISYFKPQSNDLGVTVSLFQGMQQTENQAREDEEKEIGEDGFKDPTTAGGQKTEVPGQSKRNFEEAQKRMSENMTNCDGDPFICAAQVFVNRLAIKSFERAMEIAFSPDEQDPLSDFDPYDLADPDSDPATVYHSGQAKLTQILKPKFDERADYDILAELTTCPQTSVSGQDFSPSPNNCVIDDNFSTAISEQKTVGEAMNEGYLHKDWRFAGLNEELSYNEAYTYRTVLILKKYRIVPTGWEEAIYKANENQAATLEDLVSCFSEDDDYNNFSQGFQEAEWCKGLVDPRWVLKAPANYCAKEGFGHIINKEVTEGQEVEGANDIASDIYVTRTDDYCADEQSCIKENSDGTCEAYGYCTEEKRTWNFNQDSCDPIYNTCQTFKNTNNGETISYLENTIDYASCDADSAGCKLYSLDGPYNEEKDIVDWKVYNPIYLNSNVESCASSDEGCDKLIRVKEGYGHNFIKNGGFEETNANLSLWSCGGNCLVDDDSYAGSNSLDSSLTSGYINVEVGPGKYNISGKTYTFSFYAKDCSQGDNFGFINGRPNILDDSENWQYYRVSYTYPANQYLGNDVDLEINSDTCLIDNVKLELGDIGTNYSDYGDNNVVYQKMIPEYLWDSCYENSFSGNLDFSLKEDAPDICTTNFSRFCDADEAGCMIYTNIEEKDDQVVAQTSVQDYCPGECNNYDLYIGAEDYFNSTQGAKFIPETASACSATDVGCTEFTNLDALESGGEAKEYYTSLKQCIKPSENDCAAFYVWQGSNQGGYQLESYTLKKDQNTNEPAVVEDDSSVCNEEIYNLPISNPNYNPDCYQFYNTDGDVSYHLYSKTITCSNDCHPYRMAKKNIESNINSAEDCNALGDASYFESNNNTCYYCENGGVWSSEYDSCIYQAIPGQGEPCSQEASGCREYNGNSGNNVKIVKTFDFSNSLQDWQGRCGDDIELSSETLGRNDHSLWYKQGDGSELCSEDRAEIEIGSYNLNRGSAYSIKFMAKVDTATDFDIYFKNDSGLETKFETIDSNDNSSVILQGDNEWHQYELSMESLDHRLSMDEKLVIESENSFYLDNIILREIIDRYYLIEDSWQTPEICYYDTLNNYQGADYNLGCTAYSNNSGATKYLRSFTSLCQESAVGCQLMANTFNTKDYNSALYNDTNNNDTCDANEDDCINVNADEYVFAVYNPKNSCSSEAKSCQRLGESLSYGQSNVMDDVYVKNDPDKYGTILCSETSVNCQSYVTDTGENVYFKDPGNKLCEWRKGDNNNWAWYKKDLNRCDANSNNIADEEETPCQSSDNCVIPAQILESEGLNGECSSNEDCRLNYCNGGRCTISGNLCSNDNACDNNNSCLDGNCIYQCVAPQEDFDCPVNAPDAFRTIGFGGEGNQIRQPTNNWVGLCDSNSSTCTEFIDPVSDYTVNELINPYFNDLNDDESAGDKWTIDSSDAYQNVNLIANEAYVFAANNIKLNAIPRLVCDDVVKSLSYENNFGESSSVSLNSSGDNRYRLIVSPTTQNCTVHRGTDYYDLENKDNNDFKMIFKEAIVDYQLAKNLDTETCNGKVSLEGGCILFNQRDQNNNGGLNNLDYSAYDSYISNTKTPESGDYNNANSLIKVSPNRVCDKWLACQTKHVNESGDTVCYNVADCDALDKDGECGNFLPVPDEIHTFDTARDKNSSGYSVLNNYFVSKMHEDGIRPQSSSFNFENENDSAIWENESEGENKDFYIVDEPDPLDPDLKFNASYPAEGKAFLKSKATKEVKSPEVSIERDQDYYINYLLNTNNLTFGKKAEISILEVDANDELNTLVTWEDRTNQWERKIYKFIPEDVDRIKVQIASNESDENKYVYIDDINIEPVLKVNENDEPEDYVSKSCRLYPKQDSLSCTSTNENVIASGWQGYCIQKDPYNSDICLMWYPVDTISTFTNKDSGYQGKTPLYYCSQADGNFVLAEKRKPFIIDYAGVYCINASRHTEGQCALSMEKIEEGGNLYSQKNFNFFNPLTEEQKKDYDVYLLFFRETFGGCFYRGEKKTRVHLLAIPKGVGEVEIKSSSQSNPESYEILDENYGPIYQSGSSVTYTFHPASSDQNGCAPDNDYEITFLNGESWYSYTGFEFIVPEHLFENPDNDIITINEQEVDARKDEREPDEIPYGNGEVSDDNDPLFKVYDYLDESMNPLREYGVRCNQFDQVVKNDGSNKAWSVRSETSSTSTPIFFDPYDNFLNDYKYSRPDQPFGSAILSSDFEDEGDVYFKNKKFDDNTDLEKDSYAGIPYGCDDSENEGNCENIGYCSNNPSYTCIVSPVDNNDFADVIQCDEGGVCIPYFGNLEEDEEEQEENSYVCSSSGEECAPQCELGGDCVLGDPNLSLYFCSEGFHSQCIPQCDNGAGGECIL